MDLYPALLELSKSFHACNDLHSLAKSFATQLMTAVPARAILVWFTTGKERVLACSGRVFESGIRFDPLQGPAAEGILGEMLRQTRARRFAGDFEGGQLRHFADHDQERIETALYVPVIGTKGCHGVVELLNHRTGKFTAEEAAYVEEAAKIAGRALDSIRELDAERHDSLNTIERLTALYDISTVFNSTLELEQLLPIVADRIANILGAEACNVWLVDSDEKDIYFAQQVGEDPTTDEDDRLPLGEGVIGKVAKEGQPLLIEDASENELLETRRERSTEFEIASVMAAPLLKDEEVLGVVEVVNKLSRERYTREDLFFLTSITHQAAIALNNANLLEAERRVSELDALLAIGKEITSTLNLNHVLTTVVHQAANVVPFDRCAIGLYDRNRFVLGAVSGEEDVPQTREMESLRGVMEWVAQQPEAVSADKYEGGWETHPENVAAPVTSYLDTHQCYGFYAVPLRDDQGTVGVLALLSGESEFLSERNLEMIGILASQTTVAIRNARLYQEVPLMSFWQPLVQKKQKLLSASRGRTLEWSLKAALIVLVLVAVPWKLRVGANATVVPAERRAVSAEVPGVIQRILVREGDVVEPGAVLAELDDGESRVKLAGAKANLDVALHQLAEAESNRDLAAISQARLRSEMFRSETVLYQQKVDKARLVATIAGQVVTPKVEEKVGQALAPGDLFCELVDLDHLAVEMNVSESQFNLVRPGATVALKLNSFPTDTFRANVVRISAATIAAEGEQFFVVRAASENPGRKVRPGMVGRAKIASAGGWAGSSWYPIGYVLFRSPVRWAWHKAWVWLP